MQHRITNHLNLLTAGILFLIAQSILLIPSRQAVLIDGIPRALVLLLGFLFFVVALNCFASITLLRQPWQESLVQSAAMLALAGVSSLYIKTGLYVEGALLAALSAAHLSRTLGLQFKREAPRGLLIGFVSLFNLGFGVLLLAWGEVFLNPQYQAFAPYRLILAGLFLVTAPAGGVAFFKPPKRGLELLAKSISIPWLAWGLIAAFDANLPSLIPSTWLAFILIFASEIPWTRLLLPEADIIGHRLLMVTSVVQVSFLGLFTLLTQYRVSLGDGPGEPTRLANDILFLLYLGTMGMVIYGLMSVVLTVNGLMAEFGTTAPPSTPQADLSHPSWDERVARLIKPFTSSQKYLRTQLEMQSQQVAALTNQLIVEKHRSTQLTLLTELSLQLENQLDEPVAAQLAVNTLHRALECSMVAVYVNEPERRELVALAAAGTKVSGLPPGYRQGINTGLLGRAARLRKTQVINDTRLEADFLRLESETTLSSIIVPLIDHGYLKGILEASDDRADAFTSVDVQTAEAVASELTHAWGQSDYHQRLMDLIQAGISLTTLLEPQAAVQEVAAVARQTLRARFTYVTLLDQEGNYSRSASVGHAPRLLKSLGLNPQDEPLTQAALTALRPFRVRDIRKYGRSSRLNLDHGGLRSMIGIPIRMHRLSVGAILAFGKQGEVFFTENDEALANLLASQAAAAIESAWLVQEVRSTLHITTQLYQLSYNVIQAEQLNEAARFVAETAHKVTNADSTGIVLFTPDRKIETEVQMDARGAYTGGQHPMERIEQTVASGRSFFTVAENNVSHVCLPLQTPRRNYGALWLNIPNGQGTRYATNLQTLANQAAIALERSILLVESRKQAKEIEAAYEELEFTYDHTLAALMSALDARDRETEGHSTRVSQISRQLGVAMGLGEAPIKALERGALLHDIGKIGISDTILHKPGPLTEDEWKIMRQHPDIGARIVEGIPFLQETLTVVRYHQERWDGSGYPIGMSGKDIPLLARIFAVADTFDALTSDRPYRQRLSSEDAIQYIREQSGSLFDPQVVEVFSQVAAEGQIPDAAVSE
ncbi:MAG: HD domain-containing phosphohydrolase [Chloroflexota bacterium]